MSLLTGARGAVNRGGRSTPHAIVAGALLVSMLSGGCGLPRAGGDVSGVWQGTVASANDRGQRWSGTTELVLTQDGSTVRGTMEIHHPAAGVVQIPIAAGFVRGDELTFKAQSPLGALQVAFSGARSGATMNGSARFTLRGMFGPEQETAAVKLAKSGA